MSDDPMEAWHKSQYEAAIACVLRLPELSRPKVLPTWDELTDEQRANVRKENIKSRDWFNKLGTAIATNSELPDPFET